MYQHCFSELPLPKEMKEELFASKSLEACEKEATFTNSLCSWKSLNLGPLEILLTAHCR